MGSSYRSDLRSGYMKEWEDKLRHAVRLIKEVIDESYDTIGQDGQYDNSADEGRLQARLDVAVEIVEGELPKQNAEWLEKRAALEKEKGKFFTGPQQPQASNSASTTIRVCTTCNTRPCICEPTGDDEP